jgi:hypothetical protein
MVKGKTATITIGAEVHKMIKIYCAQNNLKINEWTESQLLELMKKLMKS